MFNLATSASAARLAHPRRYLIGASYFGGLFLALGLSAFSACELARWGSAFFEQFQGRFLVFAFLSFVALFASVRWTLLMHLVIRDYLEEPYRTVTEPSDWPLVSILLPAFNEEATIGPSIESVLRFDYPHFELIVIDDGSSDATFEIASRYAGTYPFGEVRVLHKPNGGKWTAHNLGYRHTRGELILCIDADTWMDIHSLRRGVVALHNRPAADAVAGYTRVMNRNNLLLRIQALEFVVWNGALRQPQSRHGSVTCIPGPLGLFRRSALERVYEAFGRLDGPLPKGRFDGPYEGDTFAEDFDLTMAILLTGGEVLYDRLMSCDTDCPETVFSLLNQRYRWTRGSLQVMRKIFSRCRRNPEYRRITPLSWLGATYVFDVLCYPFCLVAYAGVLGTSLLGHGDLTLFLTLIGAQWAFRAICGLGFILDHREDPKLLIYLPLLDLYSTFILGGAFVISLFDEVRRTTMRW